jgi:hypothetical protein
MALATSLWRESLARSRFIHSIRSSTSGAISFRRMATRSAGDDPLIMRSAANTASNFCTAAKAIGDMMADVLPRAFEATSASSKNLRLACAQHGASVIGPGWRSEA